MLGNLVKQSVIFINDQNILMMCSNGLISNYTIILSTVVTFFPPKLDKFAFRFFCSGGIYLHEHISGNVHQVDSRDEMAAFK